MPVMSVCVTQNIELNKEMTIGLDLDVGGCVIETDDGKQPLAAAGDQMEICFDQPVRLHFSFFDGSGWTEEVDRLAILQQQDEMRTLLTINNLATHELSWKTNPAVSICLAEEGS